MWNVKMRQQRLGFYLLYRMACKAMLAGMFGIFMRTTKNGNGIPSFGKRLKSWKNVFLQTIFALQIYIILKWKITYIYACHRGTLCATPNYSNSTSDSKKKFHIKRNKILYGSPLWGSDTLCENIDAIPRQILESHFLW